MMYEIKPSRACGTVTAPPSKSVAHRYLIAAALAEGVSVIHHVPLSDDLAATMDCLSAMGADVTRNGDSVTVVGSILGRAPTSELACRECGTTLRLLLPLCLLSGEEATLTGTKKLLSRPLGAYEELCRTKGFLWQQEATAVKVAGHLTPGHYELPGNVSSQYISGLLYALSCLDGESELILTTKVESRPYIDLTIDALSVFGGRVSWQGENKLIIHGCALHPVEVTVEGDWSGAATWVAMQSFGYPLTIEGLREDSLQGDRVIIDYVKALSKGPVTLSVADCPDLAPTLMVVAALFHGATLTDTARLRHKESDRGEVMAVELAKCGIDAIVHANHIDIACGPPHPPVVPLAGHNDHRIVMANALLLTRIGGRVDGCHAVAKSYPDFFEVLAACGIEVKECLN